MSLIPSLQSCLAACRGQQSQAEPWQGAGNPAPGEDAGPRPGGAESPSLPTQLGWVSPAPSCGVRELHHRFTRLGLAQTSLPEGKGIFCGLRHHQRRARASGRDARMCPAPRLFPQSLPAEAGQATAVERGLAKLFLSLPAWFPCVFTHPCSGVTAEHRVQRQSRNAQGERRATVAATHREGPFNLEG